MRPDLLASRSGRRIGRKVAVRRGWRQRENHERPAGAVALRARQRLPSRRRRSRSPHTGGRMHKVDLAESFARITDHWNPRVAGELNGQMVKLVKFQGEFVWHRHEHEDELFLVVKGSFRLELRDRSEELSEGQFIIVPRGIEHRPVAEREGQVLLFEPSSTLNTGNVREARTRERLERL